MTSLYERRHAEAVNLARQVADILRENPELNLRLARAATAKLPGDPAALRGIPAVGGRGSVGGAIRGTRPDRRF